jgi:hypothetical protein
MSYVKFYKSIPLNIGLSFDELFAFMNKIDKNCSKDEFRKFVYFAIKNQLFENYNSFSFIKTKQSPKSWTDSKKAILINLLNYGFSRLEASIFLGTSKNSVIGVMYRNDITIINQIAKMAINKCRSCGNLLRKK